MVVMGTFVEKNVFKKVGPYMMGICVPYEDTKHGEDTKHVKTLGKIWRRSRR